jgi:hypothetical protein
MTMTACHNQSSINSFRRSVSGPRLFTSVVSWSCGGSAVRAGSSHHDPLTVLRQCDDMTEKMEKKTVNQRKSMGRKFYIISWSSAHKLADFEVENLDVLRAGALALYPPEGRRGFPAYQEKPRVVIGKRKSGPLPSDIELFHSYWLISDRLKLLFESVDPSAFAFQACDVRLSDGSTGPVYWLCDVVRVVDAFGDSTLQDIRRYREKTRLMYLGFMSAKALEFNDSVIGNCHIFRTPYSRDDVFCDQSLKDACKDAGIEGVAFHRK